MKIDTGKATEPLFTYGTLQDAKLQHILFGRVCKMHKASLADWSLHVSSKDGYLFIKPAKAGKVSGSLLDLDAEALRAADQWEEVPLLYQREKVLVRQEQGGILEAWAYTRRSGTGRAYADGQLSLVDRQTMLQEAAACCGLLKS